ncbi:MAG TPA: 30S ribosomal protein S9 [Polyangia bacterium]|nr:30S ribosomal protein S9 [Polyangia bacterium]
MAQTTTVQVEKNAFYSTGRRKQAVARVWMMPGTGRIAINKREIDDYFGRATSKMVLRQPLELTETLGRYDIYINVSGGGLSGQAEAIRLGVTRALIQINASFRPALKKAGYVTRDPRIVERKKYGQRGARARFQFSKR